MRKSITKDKLWSTFNADWEYFRKDLLNTIKWQDEPNYLYDELGIIACNLVQNYRFYIIDDRLFLNTLFKFLDHITDEVETLMTIAEPDEESDYNSEFKFNTRLTREDFDWLHHTHSNMDHNQGTMKLDDFGLGGKNRWTYLGCRGTQHPYIIKNMARAMREA